MKAKTFLFLSIVAVLAVLTTNSASAQNQNGVIKFEYCNSCGIEVPGCENPCEPGEYLVGTVCFENLLSKNNWVTKCGDGFFAGYKKNEDGNWVPTGNVYTQQGTITGVPGEHEVFMIKLFKDGKLHSILTWRFHITINANGEVTAFMDEWNLKCK